MFFLTETVVELGDMMPFVASRYGDGTWVRLYFTGQEPESLGYSLASCS